MKIFLIIIFLVSSYINGQSQPEIADYKNLVKSFYQIFYNNVLNKNDYEKSDINKDFYFIINSCKSKSYKDDTLNLINYAKMKSDTSLFNIYNQITQNLSIDELNKIVDEGEIYSDDDPFNISLDIKFPNSKIIHFIIYMDEPPRLLDIDLNNGNSVSTKKTVKLLRPGLIIDPEGFTYVRKNPNKSSKIITKFRANEIFMYTPIGDSDWWPVAFANAPLKYIGYIQKNKILPFKKFPKYLKEKLIKKPHC